MADQWASDVKIYAPDADDGVIAAIVRYCGIALQSSDASKISFIDKDETDRVRESYLKNKLGLTESDSVLDAAIASVGDRMAGDPTRNRVTVYYLLAAHFGKLGVFSASDAAQPLAAPVATGTPPNMMAAKDDRHRGAVATGWGDYVPLALLVLGGAGLLSYLGRPAPAVVPTTAPVAAVAMTPATPAIPDGMGLVRSDVDGAPFVSVYFDTAKADVSPEMTAVAADVKSYLDSHPGTGLAVSGFNDPRGDAAMNAELSKNRAFAVRAALVAAGIAEGTIDLVKPDDTTDVSTDLTNARRVDISVVTRTGTPAAVTTTEAVAAPTGQ